MSHSVAKVIYAQYAGKADLLTELLPNCFFDIVCRDV
jgi:hypothetical protein